MSDPIEYNTGGPHPTVAGNMLDPNVAADGHTSSGLGVGGTGEQTVRQEGLEHIKGNTTSPTTGSSLGSSSGSGLGGNTSSGLGGDGYSSTGASTGSYGQDTSSGLEQTNSGTQSGGILGSVKNFIGLGGNSTTTDSSTTGTTSSSYGETAPSSLGGARTGGLGGPGDSEYINSSTSGSDSRYGETAGAGALGGAALGSSSTSGRDTESTLGSSSSYGRDTDSTLGSSGRDTTEPTISGGNDALKQPDENNSVPRDNDVTTGSTPALDPTGTESATKDGGSNVSPAALRSHEHDSTRENRDAIPTAGGQKLGAKHWGESKVVPEVPKLQESGVASEVGQPDSTTRDNTNKNIGSGSAPTPGAGGVGGASPGGEKHSIADKLKSGLHLGGNKE